MLFRDDGRGLDFQASAQPSSTPISTDHVLFLGNRVSLGFRRYAFNFRQLAPFDSSSYVLKKIAYCMTVNIRDLCVLQFLNEILQTKLEAYGTS